MNPKLFDAYVECALWASTDIDDEPLDEHYTRANIADTTLAQMEQELRDFVALLKDQGINWQEHLTDEQFAHDFWLTRNGHGAGFGDRGLGPLGEELTKWAKTFGESILYVGDDNQIYVA